MGTASSLAGKQVRKRYKHLQAQSSKTRFSPHSYVGSRQPSPPLQVSRFALERISNVFAQVAHFELDQVDSNLSSIVFATSRRPSQLTPVDLHAPS